MDVEHELIENAVVAYRDEMAASLARMRAADSSASFCEAERSLHGLTRTFASHLTQLIVQERCDDEQMVDRAGEQVRERAARRGISMRAEGRRQTEFRTLSGDTVKVVTPYMRALPQGEGVRETRGSQGTGVYPVLDMLGIAGRTTAALRLNVSLAVCEANSVKSARDLLCNSGTEIDHKAALRMTYMVSDDALRARERAVRATTAGNDLGEFAGCRVVAAVDGGRVCIRRRVAGRPRKGGRKHFVTEWREPKVLTVYTVDDEGHRDRQVQVVLDGTLGDADAVFRLIRYHLLRLGVHRARELVFLGDGAKWIWNRTGPLREDLGLTSDQCTEIVDYFHVVERLTEVSAKQSTWSEDERRAWVDEQKGHLMNGDVEEAERSVLALLKRKPSDRETEAAYWLRNRERLRYGAFREAGIPIGSGAVESAVRRVVNLRMKGASIVWTEEHAEGILHLRAQAKSGRWDELESAVLKETGWRPTARRVSNAA